MMMARGLLQAGARVVISSRKADACAQAQDHLSEFGEVRAIPADLSDTTNACASPSLSPPTPTDSISSSTTLALRGASRWRASRTRRGTRCSTSISSRPFGSFSRCCPRSGRWARPTTRDHQRRQHRRHPRQSTARVLLRQQQGGAASADSGARARAGAAAHHRERGSAGTVRSKMMAATLDAFGDSIAASSRLDACTVTRKVSRKLFSLDDF